MGLSLNGLKKWFDDAAGTVSNGVAAGYHGINMFDGGQGFTTQRPTIRIAAAQPQQDNRNIFEKGFDQFNMLDNGRSWKMPEQQNDRSVFGQLTHNGLTNTVGNLTVKPVYSTLATGADAGKMMFDHVTGAPLQTQANDAAAMASRWHQSIPGFITDQGINAGKTIAALPRAVQGDVMGGSLLPQTRNNLVNQAGFALSNPAGFVMDKFGHHPHAPTQEQQAAYNQGLQGLNHTVVGQMVSPVEAFVGDHGGADARAALQAGGYDLNRTGAAKYFADPVMGAVGTYGLLKGGESVVNKGRDTMVTQPTDFARVQAAQAMLDQANQSTGVRVANPQPTSPVTIAQETPRIAPQQPSPTPTTDAVPPTGIRVGKGGTGAPAELQQPGFPFQIRDRGFINTIIDNPNTAPQVKAALTDLDNSYQTRNTEALQIKAANLVQDNPDVAMQLAKNAHDDISVAVGSEMIKALQNGGHIEQAVELAGSMAKNLTEAGRMVQAASIYGRLAPEGILRFAQNEINKYNQATGKNITLNPTAAEGLVKMATEIQNMPEGLERAQATARLVAEVQKQMPATLAEKLGTLQTMAQLLNFKTNVRNIMGNGMFGALDNFSQVVGTGLDKLLSLKTGERTTGLPSLSTQAKSFVEGGKIGVKEAREGINTGPASQFELNSVPVFRDGILNTLERTMNGTLRGADRAAYKAAFDDTIRSLQKVNKTDKVTTDMMEQAHHTALYRTFQDSNAVSDFFVGMKRSLNKIGIGTEGKRFGLGDIVLKYPKTPGNLLARGIDYSPAGFLKATYEMTKPLFGGKFNQKAFVDDFSRAAVGSGSAFALGYVLADNGIITAQPAQNKDLRNVQKTTGLGGYQINVSALKRWFGSGFNKDAAKIQPGDKLVSYDWAQPVAIPMSAGAALGTHTPVKEGAQNTVSNYANSVNTLVEQPLLQGVQRLFGGYGGIGDAVGNTIESAPASFIPTLLSQANQLIDNRQRNLNSGDTGLKGIAHDAYNQVANKIPGLAETLPGQFDVLGNPMQRYQDNGNNLFNVLFNPAFVNSYKPNGAANEVLGLYNRTGETKQTPNTAPTSIKITGADGKPQTIKLGGQTQADYQQFTGKMTNDQINQLLQDPNYQALPDSEKVKLLSGLQTDVNNAAKIKVAGDNPQDITSGTADILAGGGATGTSGNVKLAASANEKVAVAKFAKTNDKMMQFGDTLYYKSGDGTVKSMPKAEYDFNVTNAKLNLAMDTAQAKNDYQGWIGLAQQQFDALEKKKSLYDPGTEGDKIDAITLQQQNLMQKVAKYQEYGGFTKGSGSKGAKGLPSIDTSIPSGLSSPVVQLSSYKAPVVQLKNKGSVKVAARKRGSVKISAPKKLA